MTSTIPRTLLVTLNPPGGRYSAAVIYKVVDRLPPAQIQCASLQARTTDEPLPYLHAAFPPKQLHWRLRDTAANFYVAHHAQAGRLAAAIADWVAPFKPELLWVLPELGAASLAVELKSRLRIPMHLTIHDAHETARYIVPKWYYRTYAADVTRALHQADSVDAISAGMSDHLLQTIPTLAAANTIILPPSTAVDNMRQPPPALARPTDAIRRIGLCGSMRISEAQWRRFLDTLGVLSFQFEVITFANADLFHRVAPPRNVTIVERPFAETEEELIKRFHDYGVHACHLGLWQEDERALFGRTSLSAKLTTYAATGLPVIVDAREDSGAWRLVSTFGAGVRCGGDRDHDASQLQALFSDSEQWSAMALGSQRLARETFDINRNVERLSACLVQTRERCP
ncbi:MAG: hypothetical protein O3A51_07195 [Verrucomicrobia bacterium]|nr:hypothetical protein [Verrucomicrobiota bacterium]